MSSATQTELPNLAEILLKLLQRVPREQHPLLIAIAERRAAERYRSWADDPAVVAHRGRLLACADREEEIAHRVEGLHPEAAAVQRGIVAANPDLDDITRSLFAGRPLAQQFAIQAEGERLGAATWRSFGRGASAAARDTFLACAGLEEESAAVLESILAEWGA